MTDTLQVHRVTLSWNEDDVLASGGNGKMTKCSAEYQLSGDIEGTSSVAYSMLYLPDGSARFNGFEWISGRIKGGTGSLVLSHTGVFQDLQATIAVAIVPGTAMGTAAGMAGEGEIVSSMSNPREGSLTLRLVADA